MINLCSLRGNQFTLHNFTVFHHLWTMSDVEQSLSFGEFSGTFTYHFFLNIVFQIDQLRSSRKETRLCRHGSKNCTFLFPGKGLKATSSSPCAAVTILATAKNYSIIFVIDYNF